MKHSTDIGMPARLMGCCISSNSSKSASAPVTDPEVLRRLDENTRRAKSIADAPFEAYTGQLSAGSNPFLQQAGGMLPGAANAGADTLNAGASGARSLLGFQPSQISAVASSAPTAGLSFASPASAGNASTANPFQMNAVTGNAAQMGPTAQASYGNANTSQANAASINRGDVRNLSGGEILPGISKYMNPYTDSVVNTTLADLERSRQIQRVHDQQSANAGKAFGGSRHGVADSLTNEAYGRNAASTAAGLRQAGFNTAAGLSESDASRALQASLANQGVDLNVAGQNAGFGQQANLTNAAALNDTSRFNASNALQNNQFNAGAENARSQYNAGNEQQTSLANLGFGNAAASANQAAQNRAAEFNATGANDMARFDAANQQATNFANAGAANSNAQFNAGNELQNNQFNASANNAAQLANQNAGIAGAGLNLNAANLSGQLGGQQQDQALAGANALNTFGQQQQGTEQSALDRLLAQFNYGDQRKFDLQQLLNQAFGLVPGALGQSSVGKSSGFGFTLPMPGK